MAATCSNDVVKATWLNQMGYTYKKQDPNWLPTDAQQFDARVPVGGGVEYYCKDPAKRPKLDRVSCHFLVILTVPNETSTLHIQNWTRPPEFDSI